MDGAVHLGQEGRSHDDIRYECGKPRNGDEKNLENSLGADALSWAKDWFAILYLESSFGPEEIRDVLSGAREEQYGNGIHDGDEDWGGNEDEIEFSHYRHRLTSFLCLFKNKRNLCISVSDAFRCANQRSRICYTHYAIAKLRVKPSFRYSLVSVCSMVTSVLTRGIGRHVRQKAHRGSTAS